MSGAAYDLFGEPSDPEVPAPSEETEEDFSVPEGLSPPRTASECFGHKSIEKMLLSLIGDNKLPHGLIFAGQKGIGKATMAFRLAHCLLNNPQPDTESLSTSPDSPASRQIAAGAHPDLLSIESEKNTVDVELARKIAPFLRRTASRENGWRVVILDDADTMNRNAQNAVLKILEEPPSQTVLILIAHRPGVFLPTIRSRCRMIPFHEPERTVFEALLNRSATDVPFQDMDHLYNLCNGSPGQALTFIDDGGIEILERVMALLPDISAGKAVDLHAFAASVKDNAFPAFRDILLWLAEEEIKKHARGEEVSACLMPAEAGVEEKIRICEALRAHFETVERSYLDKQIAVLGAFSILRNRNT